MKVDKDPMATLYRKRAPHYDVTANSFYLIGFREWAYRKQAVSALELKLDDTVVEIGCGTGLNFPLLEEKTGPTGRIIGVDLTNAMLDRARCRIQKHGWRNVKLIESDATAFRFPEKTNAVIATFALKTIPGYDTVIRNAAQALVPGGRLVFLELTAPAWCPAWLRRVTIRLLNLFGATEENAAYRPEA